MTDASAKTVISRVVSGFILSLLVTLTAYFLVIGNAMAGLGLLVLLGLLALAQFFVQMLFFLHVGEEKRPRYKLAAMGFMALVLVIIVAGSLWIMYHLNYNMMQMEPVQKDAHMHVERDKGF